MKSHKFKVVVTEDGKITIEDLPVKKGQSIEVVVNLGEVTPPDFPLRGLPVRLHEPFLPATDESDWDAST